MGEEQFEKYRSDVAEARQAFGDDPTYAIVIARQAGTLLSRLATKAARAEGPES